MEPIGESNHIIQIQSVSSCRSPNKSTMKDFYTNHLPASFSYPVLEDTITVSMETGFQIQVTFKEVNSEDRSVLMTQEYLVRVELLFVYVQICVTSW